jgi:Alw26I/Eco31I/Esp3I family type II restriction endonuclease
MSEIGYHPNYDKYVEMIVAHPNYKGLYYDRDKNGKVNWVVTGKSLKGQKRQAWWDATCKKLGIPIQKGCYAKAARLIHPTGIHVCQCCGEGRSIFYEYPTLRTLKKLNEEFGLELEQTDYTIREFVREFCTSKPLLDKLAHLLKIPTADNADNLIAYIKEELIDKESSLFSPGVMCNPPDRYNGFHSYALCCRKAKDTGRHDENMKTYTQDRRAYEDWSDGDYNLANRLMGEFHKQPPMACPVCGNVDNMSADHIGPVSLGFCHSKHFTPMCKSCNSSKNNRFTKADVDTLIALEKKGSQVVSWHSKYIWDIVKHNISNDIEAKKASSIMAKCHQNILNILAIIHQKTGKTFLMRYLHPEYSMMDYRFENFDLKHLDRMTILATPLDSKNKRKNQERYIRIAFESLEDFLAKQNRKNYFLIGEESSELKPILAAIKIKDYDMADKRLKSLIEEISKKIFLIENGLKTYTHEEFEGYTSMVAENSDKEYK